MEGKLGSMKLTNAASAEAVPGKNAVQLRISSIVI